MSLVGTSLNPSSVARLAAGANVFNTLALRGDFTVIGSYTFEQLSGTDPIDTVGILYTTFDSANPQSGYITGNDDAGTFDPSGLKPMFTFTIDAPGTRDIVISTYNAGTTLGLPQGFEIRGPGLVNIFAITPYSGPPPEELSAVQTGLPMANVLGQMLISGNQTATSDVNNHIFGLMAGDGEEAANSSLSASLDEGVVIGQGDGPEDPIAHKVLRSRQWEVYTTVNYGYLDLNALGGQAGVNVESWAPGIGIERHLSRGLAVGFAVSFLQSWQDYSGGLGSLDLEGPALSTYLTFVRKNYWSSLLYSFGSYELDSTRNPGLGFPQAYGSTHSYTNSVQYNTGWNFRFQNNTLLTGPFAGIDYLHGTVDAYSETGGGAAALRYAEQSYESLVTRVGWSASKKIKTDFASITPQVRLSYERQNLENNGTSVALLNAPFTAAGGNQSPGQDYLAAGAGVNFAFNDQLSVLLSYQGQFFRSDMSAHMGALRLSYKF
jgi:uncharacterized protein YhjY with autotransporter beta-barrel domain